MEEVFGNFWRDVLGESDSVSDEDEAYVRVRRPREDADARAVPISAPGGVELRQVTRRTFRGVVRAPGGRDEGTLVDVLFADAEGRSASARVRIEDGHRGFLGKILTSWKVAMVEESDEEGGGGGGGGRWRLEGGGGGRARWRRRASGRSRRRCERVRRAIS